MCTMAIGSATRFRWWVRQQKSSEFQSIHLSSSYQPFGRHTNVDHLDLNEQLIEAQARAQAFVDRCEQIEKEDNPKEKEHLKQMQWNEMTAVFNFACQSK
jgi:hypothetical protein